MKKSLGFLVVLALLLAPMSAEARRHRGGFGGSPGSSTFGLGLILLSPTGLSGEIRLGPRSGLDFAVGFDFFDDDDDYDDDGLIQVDYLAYLADLSRGGSVSLPLYLGIGGVLLDHDRGRDDHFDFGFRVPFGLAIALRTVPVQFFFEGALRFLFLDDHDGDGDDDTDLDVTFGLGFRVYF